MMKDPRRTDAKWNLAVEMERTQAGMCCCDPPLLDPARQKTARKKLPVAPVGMKKSKTTS
jgi:hypothetical protein